MAISQLPLTPWLTCTRSAAAIRLNQILAGGGCNPLADVERRFHREHRLGWDEVCAIRAGRLSGFP
jgi:hypothetical protein